MIYSCEILPHTIGVLQKCFLKLYLTPCKTMKKNVSSLRNPMKKNIILCTVLTVLYTLNLVAQDIYVTPVKDLTVTQDGTFQFPYQKIQYALDSTSGSGRTILLKEGVYHEEVIINNLDNITIKPEDNANVVLTGAEVFGGTWIHDAGNIYKLPVQDSIWQLFIDDQECIMARWPNTTFEEDQIYNKYLWAHGNASLNSNGLMKDITPDSIGDITQLGNIDGALIIANVGSFRTFVRTVNSDVQNSQFTYSQVPSNEYKTKEHFYFLEGKKHFLDQANEWFYGVEGNQKYVYAWSEVGDGTDLQSSIVRGKSQTYAFDIRESNTINIEGLKFFSTTVRIESSEGVTIRENIFKYPNCSKRMLGDTTSPLVTSIDQNLTTGKLSKGTSKRCEFEQCTFEYTDGEALIFAGDSHVVHNNYFHHIDYSCAETQAIGLTIYATGAGNIFSNNVIHTTGASATLNMGEGARIVYNDISNTGHAQSDGSIVQITKNLVEGSETAYNWLHDSPKYGFRFDAVVGDAASAGKKGLAHHNVIWNLGDPVHNSGGIGMMIKGDQQEIYSNTVFNCLKTDLLILEEEIKENGISFSPKKYTNQQTITKNNAADFISNHRTQFNPFPGTQNNNFYGEEGKIISLLKNVVAYDKNKVLENGQLYDFRPKQNAVELIDQGEDILQTEWSSISLYVTDGFKGVAPDIGAYEKEASARWYAGLTNGFQPSEFIWPSGVVTGVQQTWNQNNGLYILPQKNDVFQIQSTELYSEFKVYSTDGRLVHEDNSSSLSFTLSHVPDGIYILHVKLESGEYIKTKFLKH